MSIGARVVGLGAVLLGWAAAAQAQVSMEPIAVFLGPSQRSAVIRVSNGPAGAVELEAVPGFGYLRTNERGETTFPVDTVAPKDEPSLLPWFRVTPRRLRLEPGEERLVRVHAAVPDTAAPGEYWGRILVSPVEDGSIEGNGGTVTLRTVVPVAVLYRQGPVTTGVEVVNAVARVEGPRVRLVMSLARRGEAAFIGRVRARLVGADGTELASGEVPTAVYRRAVQEVLVEVPDGVVPPGSVVVYGVETVRPDLPGSGLLKAETARGRVEVERP